MDQPKCSGYDSYPDCHSSTFYEDKYSVGMYIVQVCLCILQFKTHRVSGRIVTAFPKFKYQRSNAWICYLDIYKENWVQQERSHRSITLWYCKLVVCKRILRIPYVVRLYDLISSGKTILATNYSDYHDVIFVILCLIEKMLQVSCCCVCLSSEPIDGYFNKNERISGRTAD